MAIPHERPDPPKKKKKPPKPPPKEQPARRGDINPTKPGQQAAGRDTVAANKARQAAAAKKARARKTRAEGKQPKQEKARLPQSVLRKQAQRRAAARRAAAEPGPGGASSASPLRENRGNVPRAPRPGGSRGFLAPTGVGVERHPVLGGGGKLSVSKPRYVTTGPALAPGNVRTISIQRAMNADGAALKVDGKHGAKTQRELEIRRRAVGQRVRNKDWERTQDAAREAHAGRPVADVYSPTTRVFGQPVGEVITFPRSQYKHDPILHRSPRGPGYPSSERIRAMQEQMRTNVRIGQRRSTSDRQLAARAYSAHVWLAHTRFNSPENAARAHPHDVLAFFFDPQFGRWSRLRLGGGKVPATPAQVGNFIAHDARGTNLMRAYLRANGHKKTVAKHGYWDDSVQTAVKLEMKEMRRVELRQARRAIEKLFWDSGIIRPQKGPGGVDPRTQQLIYLPFAKGYIDIDDMTPRQLHKILQNPESPLARILWKELVGRLRTQRDAISLAMAAGYMTSGQRVDGEQLWYMIKQRRRAEFLDATKDKPQWYPLVGAFNATMDAWTWLTEEAERGYGVMGQIYAEHGELGQISVGNVYRGGRAREGDSTITEGNTSLYEYYREADAWFDEFDKKHPWWGLAIDFIADPLNLPAAAYAVPFKLAGRTIRGTARLGEKASTKSADYIHRAEFLPDRLDALAAVPAIPYHAGKWSARKADEFWSAAAPKLRQAPVLRHAVSAMQAMGKMKSQVLQEAGYAGTLAYHKMVMGGNRGEAAVELARVKRAKQMKVPVATLRLADQALDDFVAVMFPGAGIPALPGLNDELIQYLVKNEAAVFARAEGGTYSKIGAVIAAKVINRVKGGEINVLVWDEAVRGSEKLVLDYGNFDVEWRSWADQWGVDPEKMRQIYGVGHEGFEQGSQAYVDFVQDEFARYLLRSPLYSHGAGDPRIAAMIEKRVDPILEGVHQTFMLRLHKLVEAQLPPGRLFDESGKSRTNTPTHLRATDEPPIEQGHLRFYRGTGAKRIDDPALERFTSWWTDDRRLAEADMREFPMGELHYVDVVEGHPGIHPLGGGEFALAEEVLGDANLLYRKRQGTPSYNDAVVAEARAIFERGALLMPNPNYKRVFGARAMNDLKSGEQKQIVQRVEWERVIDEAAGNDRGDPDFWKKVSAFQTNKVEAAWQPYRGGYTDMRPVIAVPAERALHLMDNRRIIEAMWQRTGIDLGERITDDVVVGPHPGVPPAMEAGPAPHPRSADELEKVGAAEFTGREAKEIWDRNEFPLPDFGGQPLDELFLLAFEREADYLGIKFLDFEGDAMGEDIVAGFRERILSEDAARRFEMGIEEAAPPGEIFGDVTVDEFLDSLTPRRDVVAVLTAMKAVDDRAMQAASWVRHTKVRDERGPIDVFKGEALEFEGPLHPEANRFDGWGIHFTESPADAQWGATAWASAKGLPAGEARVERYFLDIRNPIDYDADPPEDWQTFFERVRGVARRVIERHEEELTYIKLVDRSDLTPEQLDELDRAPLPAGSADRPEVAELQAYVDHLREQRAILRQQLDFLTGGGDPELLALLDEAVGVLDPDYLDDLRERYRETVLALRQARQDLDVAILRAEQGGHGRELREFRSEIGVVPVEVNKADEFLAWLDRREEEIMGLRSWADSHPETTALLEAEGTALIGMRWWTGMGERPPVDPRTQARMLMALGWDGAKQSSRIVEGAGGATEWIVFSGGQIKFDVPRRMIPESWDPGIEPPRPRVRMTETGDELESGFFGEMGLDDVRRIMDELDSGRVGDEGLDRGPFDVEGASDQELSAADRRPHGLPSRPGALRTEEQLQRIMPRQEPYLYYITDSADLRRIVDEGLFPRSDQPDASILLAEGGVGAAAFAGSDWANGRHLFLRVDRSVTQVDALSVDVWTARPGSVPPHHVEYLDEHGVWQRIRPLPDTLEDIEREADELWRDLRAVRQEIDGRAPDDAEIPSLQDWERHLRGKLRDVAARKRAYDARQAEPPPPGQTQPTEGFDPTVSYQDAELEYFRQLKGAFGQLPPPNLIRNSDGTPRLFHHGTTEQFERFSDEFIGRGLGSVRGAGHYFAFTRAVPGEAAAFTRGRGRIVSVNLSYSNPLRAMDDLDVAFLQRFARAARESGAERWVLTRTEEWDAYVRGGPLPPHLRGDEPPGGRIQDFLEDFMDAGGNASTRVLRRMGYDAIESYDTGWVGSGLGPGDLDEVIVFDASQVHDPTHLSRSRDAVPSINQQADIFRGIYRNAERPPGYDIPGMPNEPNMGAVYDELGMTEAEFRSLYSKHRNEAEIERRTAVVRHLKGQGAYWEALRHTQGKGWRALYWGLAGSLGLWRFFTLAMNPGWVVRNVADNFAKLMLQGAINPRAWFLEGIGAVKTVFDVNVGMLRAAMRFIDRIHGQMPARRITVGEAAEFEGRFLRQLGIIKAAEKHDLPVGEVRKMLDEHATWESFSRARGYSEDEIADFQRWMDMQEEGRRLGYTQDDLIEMVHFGDKLGGPTGLAEKVGNPASAWFDEILEGTFWGAPLKAIEDIMRHYDIPIDRAVLEQMTFVREGGHVMDTLLPRAKKRAGPYDDWKGLRVVPGRSPRDVGSVRLFGAPDPKLGIRPRFDQRVGSWMGRMHDGIWELMGTRPENIFRRVLYRDKYEKAIRNGASAEDASRIAWEAVEKTLFDYSKISVVEDNLRLFFPFIQFWRKNFGFWLRTVKNQPWFLHDLSMYQDTLEEVHADQPPWMRRYISLKEVSDIIARVPGLGWMAEHLENARIDPLNFLSFAPLYRAFKSSNPNLPPEEAGLGFLRGFMEGLNEWGTSLNPFIRKPLEWFGVLDFRSWQNIFPQTSLIDGFTEQHLRDFFPNGLNIEAWLADPILNMLGKDTLTERTEQKFNYYVQLEMAGQGARGEEVSRARAENKIRSFLWAKTLVGFFAGTYIRRMTPQDAYFSQLAYGMATGQFNYMDLSAEQKAVYRLYKFRNWDIAQYDRYVEALPLIRSYYNKSFGDAQQMLLAHPELIPFVSRNYYRPGKFSPNLAQEIMLQQRNQDTFDLFHLIDQTDIPYRVRQIGHQLLITPEIRRYWNRNPEITLKDQLRMIRGQYQKRIDNLHDNYYAISDWDYEAKAAYLAQHPELERYWQVHGSASDDFRTIQFSVERTLRDRYFEILEGPSTKDGDENFDAAVKFLQKFPFIFDGTAYRRKYREIARVGHYPGYTPGQYARGNRNYGISEHARDYLHARPYLDKFFTMLERRGKDAAYAWLDGNSKGAAIVRAYFKEYAKGGRVGSTPKARAYLRAKKALDYFFSLPKNRREKWLWGRSAMAKQVREYFRKYAEGGLQRFPDRPMSQHQKDYLAAKDALKLYFSMSEEERVKWLQGSSREAEIVRDYFDKYADERGQTQHAKDYLAIKPVLEAYFALPKGQARRDFLAAHPELADYFAKYAETDKTARAFNDGPDSWGPNTPGAYPYIGADGLVHWYVNYSDRRGSGAFRRQSFRPGRRRLPGSDNWMFASMDPKLRRRLEFWRIYFALPPDQRPQFVLEHAEEYGVFVYGALGPQDTADQQSDLYAKAFAFALNGDRSMLYGLLQPLIDFYFSLEDPMERQLMLRANPELQQYFDLAQADISTGDPALDALLEQYFRLPKGSRMRSILLDQNPNLKAWLEANSTQEDDALHALLEVYFTLSSAEKRQYRIDHPELQEYFDKRAAEKDNEKMQLEAFDRADPRLKKYFDAAEDEIRYAAWLRQQQMLHESLKDIVLENRRDRRQEEREAVMTY